MGDHASSAGKLPYLSPSEWRIFSLLSKRGSQTVRQLMAALGAEDRRSYTTVLTLAQRLSAKGYLTQKSGVARHGPASAITYSASVPFDEAFQAHARRFLAQYVTKPEDLLEVRLLIDQILSDR